MTDNPASVPNDLEHYMLATSRYRAALKRLVEACEKRLVTPHNSPEVPAEYDAWIAVIKEHIAATENARAVLDGDRP